VRRIADMVKSSEPELIDHVEKLLASKQALERQLDQFRDQHAHATAARLSAKAKQIPGGIKWLAERVDGMDRQQMRTVADSLRNEWKTAGVVVLASVVDGNISIIAAVTKDLAGKVNAGKLAGTLARAVGGKGGGRPDMAEGGGKDVPALDTALANVRQELETQL
jgi:alanyl-tRNA synthetase